MGIHEVVDEQTREISTISTSPRPGDLDVRLANSPPPKARPISDVAGKPAPLYNLKDNPDFDGRAFTVVGIRDAEGEHGYHAYLYGFLSNSGKPGKHDEPCVIRTGSEYVLSRILQARTAIDAGTSFFGVFRMAGRAWMFD